VQETRNTEWGCYIPNSLFLGRIVAKNAKEQALIGLKKYKMSNQGRNLQVDP
jgi:hypothetical protein